MKWRCESCGHDSHRLIPTLAKESDFGGQDLKHDIMLQKHFGFENIADYLELFKIALEGKEKKF